MGERKSMPSTSQGLPKSHPPTVSPEGELALWSAANLAGMQTGHLILRESFFRRMLNKLTGKRRRRVIRLRRPSPQQSLPMLAKAGVGSSRSTIIAVFGPPRSAVVSCEADGVVAGLWEAQTWYYPMPRKGPMAMAINFDEDHASCVEFF